MSQRRALGKYRGYAGEDKDFEVTLTPDAHKLVREQQSVFAATSPDAF